MKLEMNRYFPQLPVISVAVDLLFQETLTNDLDEKYSHLLGKVKAIFRPPGAKKEAVETDDYDKLVSWCR